jgi:hypothetical protein
MDRLRKCDVSIYIYTYTYIHTQYIYMYLYVPYIKIFYRKNIY